MLYCRILLLSYTRYNTVYLYTVYRIQCTVCVTRSVTNQLRQTAPHVLQQILSLMARETAGCKSRINWSTQRRQTAQLFGTAHQCRAAHQCRGKVTWLPASETVDAVSPTDAYICRPDNDSLYRPIYCLVLLIAVYCESESHLNQRHIENFNQLLFVSARVKYVLDS